MFIERVKNNGTDYLRVTEVFRDETVTPPRRRFPAVRTEEAAGRFYTRSRARFLSAPHGCGYGNTPAAKCPNF